MTSILRRLGMCSLVMVVAAFTMLAASPAMAQEDTCYPVPAGGCPEVEAECADIIAAIAGDDVALDQNGDGVIDSSDLPADCGCAELLQGIADGTLQVGDLPDGALADCDCESLQELVDAGILSADDLPEDCVTGEVEPDPDPDPEAAVMADTGIDAGGMAAITVGALLAGAVMLTIVRRREV